MKNNIRVCLVIGLFLLIFTVCYFVIPYPYENNTVFTLGYIFAIIAFLAQIYTLYKGLMKDSSLKSKVYGLPLIRVGFIYLAVQVIITLLLNIINAFVYLPSWICIVLNILIIGVFAIGLITVEGYKETIEKEEMKEVINTLFLDDLKTNVKALYNKFDYEPLKKKMKDLYELIIYSDPVSHKDLVSLEDEISRKLNSLKSSFNNKDYTILEVEMNDLQSLMEERNYRCKKLK